MEDAVGASCIHQVLCFNFSGNALYPDMRRGRSRHRDNLVADKRSLIVAFAVLLQADYSHCWTRQDLV